jgi:hypothetical protein
MSILFRKQHMRQHKSAPYGGGRPEYYGEFNLRKQCDRAERKNENSREWTGKNRRNQPKKTYATKERDQSCLPQRLPVETRHLLAITDLTSNQPTASSNSKATSHSRFARPERRTSPYCTISMLKFYTAIPLALL